MWHPMLSQQKQQQLLVLSWHVLEFCAASSHKLYVTGTTVQRWHSMLNCAALA
jgi:hypothetical protein